MNKYMKLAMLEARKGIFKKEGGPFGAMIVKDGEVIAKAHSKVDAYQSAISHASVLAIQKACRKLKSIYLEGCDIYLTVQPCPFCLGGIIGSHIRNIYYGCSGEESCAIGFGSDFAKVSETLNSMVPMVQVDHEECQKLLAMYAEFTAKSSK